jgi:hypothetical protein
MQLTVYQIKYFIELFFVEVKSCILKDQKRYIVVVFFWKNNKNVGFERLLGFSGALARMKVRKSVDDFLNYQIVGVD